MAAAGEGGSGDGGGESSPPSAAALATLNIRSANGTKFTVQADLGSTVGAFKEVVAGTSDVPAPQQRLIYKGRILKDEQTLESYGVETDHTIHLVRGVAQAAASGAPAAASPGASTTPTSGPAGGLGGLFPGLGATGAASGRPAGLFGAGLPELDQMQQQLSQNPNLMRDIMNMPMMQNLMNNPDLIRNMIMNNPQMRDIIDRNPDLAHVLNDPSVLRQTLEAARNPEIMREMMRNTDRAMSNIESSPEGFNMLRRMYETVQEPFLNATTMGGGGEGTPASNPFAALLGNQGPNQPGGPATNAPSTGPESTTGTPVPNTNPLPNPWNTNAGAAQGATRSGPAGNTRTAATGGLGGLGSLDLSSLLGGLGGNAGTGAPGGLGGPGSADLSSLLGGPPDASQLSQMLQNPAMMQMMQNIMSDPQSMNQLLNMNPNARNLMESNTQLRDMFQNPEFLRQMTSPEALQQLLSFQQTLSSQLGQHQPSQDGNLGNGTGTRGNVGLDTLMGMLSGLGAGGGLGVPTSNVPPEELYATQLGQLQEMGFFDTAENIRALMATSGNVHAAVERLLGNLGQ